MLVLMFMIIVYIPTGLKELRWKMKSTYNLITGILVFDCLKVSLGTLISILNEGIFYLKIKIYLLTVSFQLKAPEKFSGAVKLFLRSFFPGRFSFLESSVFTV